MNLSVMEDMMRIHDSKTLGVALQRHRKARGFTQARLAEIAGLNQKTISNIEQGGAVEVSTVFAICHALGLDLQIVAREGAPKSIKPSEVF